MGGYFNVDRVPFDGRPLTPPHQSRPMRRYTHRRNHGPLCSSHPEFGCVCGYDAGDDPNAEPAAVSVPAGQLRAGQRVWIYGETLARLTAVEPDPGDHDSPWVRLHYRVASSGAVGVWPLPASQKLPLQP